MKMLEPYEFWKNVDQILELRNMNLKKLCSQMDIAYKTLTMQRSRQTYPKADILGPLAEGLNVSVDYLLTGSEISAPCSARSMRIAHACDRAEEEDLFVIEKILGLRKSDVHTVSETLAG